MKITSKCFTATLSAIIIFTAAIDVGWAQESPKLNLMLGLSTWFNNCDVPAGGQDAERHPSFGPHFQLTYDRFRMGGTFYSGTFDVHPHDGIIHGSDLDPHVPAHSSVDTVVFTDDEARARGFTSSGETKRVDFSINAGYVISQYVTISLSFVINRHEVDLLTYWHPVSDSLGAVVAIPSEQRAPLSYVDTQYWAGQHFSGVIPVKFVSADMSFFYGASLLVILGETGHGSASSLDGSNSWPLGARASYTDSTGAPAEFKPRSLGNRSFGENVGVAFNAGLGFQLFDRPAISIFGGYNTKFFSEDETDLIASSHFRGPYLGLTWLIN